MPRKLRSLPKGGELARLQQQLLKAALLGEALPGGASARLADQAFILRHPQIHLSEETLGGAISIQGLPKPLRIVSEGDVRRETATGGDVAYLRFLPLEEGEGGSVWLTLEGRLAMSDPAQHPMGLSRVQVRLGQVGGRWELTGETRALAG